MTFSLPEHWVWDLWVADDGDRFHLYYLHAPKSLGNPDLRHRNARIGHAVSSDLRQWTDYGECLGPVRTGFSELDATWTGSVIQSPDGRWLMFYTATRFLSEKTHANIETVAVAESTDLHQWVTLHDVRVEAEPSMYEVLGGSSWPEQAWRDPWVFPEDENSWGMLLTARSTHGVDERDRGVIGYAHSSNLTQWTVGPALSEPGSGFAHLEVPQLVEIDGQDSILFSCDTGALAGSRLDNGERGGIWAVDVDLSTGLVDMAGAHLVLPDDWYAGRAVRDRAGHWSLLAFHNGGGAEGFTGVISDPMPLERRGGRLQVQRDEECGT